MHPSSMENMKVARKHLGYLHTGEPIALDVGGVYKRPCDSYLRIFEDVIDSKRWIVVDIQDKPGVDVIMPGPYQIPFDDETFDLVVSGQMLEHCVNPFKSVAEMRRVLKTGCMMVLIAPSSGAAHGKRDGWRFGRDAFQFIAQDIGGLKIVDDWICVDAEHVRSRKWQDHVFVGEKLSYGEVG